MTSPSPARSPASIPALLSRSERLPMRPHLISLCGMKFRLKNKLHQAICRHNKKRRAGRGMPEINVVTEVAGRVCALPVEVGGNVADGEDIAFVEAMKMEIPVASPAAGTLKSILVKID